MGSKTDYLENKILDYVLRNQAAFATATVYLALFTATPSDTGGGTEVSGGSYARQAITFGAASGGSITNSGTVTFSAATADWGTVTSFAIMDAATSGNMLYWGALSANKTINNGDQIVFNASSVTITED